jgi:hypothetical protein
MASDSDQGRQGVERRPRGFKLTRREQVVWNLHIGQWAGRKRTNILHNLYNCGKHTSNMEFDTHGISYAAIQYAEQHSTARSTARARGI